MRNTLHLLTRSAFWAIRPEAVAEAITMLQPRIEGASRMESAWEAAKPTVQGRPGNKTAVVPIEGVLTQDGPSWYGSNYATIARAVEMAANDPEIKRIVLSVDSPGGEVTGLPETAAVIAQAAKIKPVSAIVTGMSASAAYYLTSQANDITLTPSGEVGSVGVRMMHMDVSKMLENFGVKVTELYSGEHKTEWSPYKPLPESAVADMQPRLEAVHADFIDAVKAGRGPRATQDIQDKRFGEGRMFSASDALSNGMVDKIQATRDFFKTIIPVAEHETSAPAFPFRARHDHDVATAEV